MFKESIDAIIYAFEQQQLSASTPITVGLTFLKQYTVFICALRWHSWLAGSQQMIGFGLNLNRISSPKTLIVGVLTITCAWFSSFLTKPPDAFSISNKAVPNGAVLSHVNNHKLTLRVAHATYGVVCALPVNKNNEEHIRRMHQWESDPTGECYVPDFFEAKLCKVSFFLGQSTRY